MEVILKENSVNKRRTYDSRCKLSDSPWRVLLDTAAPHSHTRTHKLTIQHNTHIHPHTFSPSLHRVEWLLRLPMTKAVVRAMDGVQKNFASYGIDKFVVAVRSFMVVKK